MSTTISRPAAEANTPAGHVSRRHWILIFLLLGSTVVNFLDRQTLSILAPTIKAEFRMSNAAYGWVITAFQVSYLVMYSVGGRLADIFGVRRAMIYFVSWWSVACIGQGFIVGPKSLAAVRSLLAVGEGGNWPAAVKAVAEQIPGSLRSLAVGRVAWIPFAGAAVGNYAGGGVASWLISRGLPTLVTRRLIMSLAAAGSSLGIVAAYTSSLGLAVAAATFSAFFYMSWAVNLQTMTVDFFPPSCVGTVFGFAGSGSSLGTMLAAPAIGAVLDRTHDYGPLLVIIGLILPVTQLIVMLLAGGGVDVGRVSKRVSAATPRP